MFKCSVRLSNLWKKNQLSHINANIFIKSTLFSFGVVSTNFRRCTVYMVWLSIYLCKRWKYEYLLSTLVKDKRDRMWDCLSK